MVQEAKSLDRTAQSLVVQAKRAHGMPPEFDTVWKLVWGAKVERVEINRDSRSSTATIWFPDLRWHQTKRLLWGDAVRIRTNERASSDRTILFSGFLTAYLSDFSGGTDQPGSAYERNAVVCSDHRWLLSTTSPIFGQFARGPDDYADYGAASQAAIDNKYTFLSGRRAIFNAKGKPDRDAVSLKVLNSAGTQLCEMPLFTNPGLGCYWTARDMLRYVLSPLQNKAYNYLTIDDPSVLTGLNHGDWDKVLNHVVAEGLSITEVLQTICRQLGWSFREDYKNDGTVEFVFYKIGAASQYSRDGDNPTILQRLHAPAAGESVGTPVGKGKKLLWSMSLAEDIGRTVNRPWGLAAPHRFEFTAELVPGWLDDDLEPDTSNSNANLFLTDAQLQKIADKNGVPFYKYYYPRGAGFRRDVGRKWVLNESGAYSDSDSYDRGMPFDFSDYLPDDYILSDARKRLFAPFNRRLLPCLTVDKDDLSSVGIKVEFSFDGGVSWQAIPAAIPPLSDECGIYIAEANLAELVDESESFIPGGVLDGVQMNYFTSLCDDKLNARSFKAGDWHTRVRVTASVQMDQRLRIHAEPTSSYGSPFHHSQVYDFSEKYGLSKRTESSIFDGGDLPARELDSTDYFDKHLLAIRDACQDMSISGRFTLERLWLGDGSGVPDFAVGDCIEEITGRDYNLVAALGERTVYPEIVRIIYLPDKQKMQLITRDLRFAEVPL